jgi:hypothetical protein
MTYAAELRDREVSEKGSLVPWEELCDAGGFG